MKFNVCKKLRFCEATLPIVPISVASMYQNAVELESGFMSLPVTFFGSFFAFYRE